MRGTVDRLWGEKNPSEMGWRGSLELSSTPARIEATLGSDPVRDRPETGGASANGGPNTEGVTPPWVATSLVTNESRESSRPDSSRFASSMTNLTPSSLARLSLLTRRDELTTTEQVWRSESQRRRMDVHAVDDGCGDRGTIGGG